MSQQYKYLDYNGLNALIGNLKDKFTTIDNKFLPKAGGTMTGTLTSQNILPGVHHTTSATGYSLGSSSNQFNTTYTRFIDTASNYNLRLKAGGTEHINMLNGQINIIGNVSPTSNNTYTLGNSSYKWNKVYATTFEGNATSATKLASDAGNYLTPVYFSGGKPIVVSGIRESMLITRQSGAGLSRLEGVGDTIFSVNRLAYKNPNDITIEYSNNGGATWLDYGADDNQKKGLCTMQGYTAFYLGKKHSGTTSNPFSQNDMLRITIAANDRYFAVQKFLIYMSTSYHGARAGVYVDTYRSSWQTPNDWVLINSNVNINGWDGWNSVIATESAGGVAWGASNQPANTGYFRFVFKYGNGESEYTTKENGGANIQNIFGYGDTFYSGTSLNTTLAKTGHLYLYDVTGRASFPGDVFPYIKDNNQWLGNSEYQWNRIYGKTIYENGTSLANTYLGKTAAAIKTGDGSNILYANQDNEINFGGTAVSDAIYFGYRATDSKAIPSKFVFGSATGTAELLAKTYKKTDGTEVSYNGHTHTKSQITDFPAIPTETTVSGWGFTKNTGTVTGPSSSVNNRVAVFDGTTGKKIKDSGYTIAKSVPSNAVFTDTNTKVTQTPTDTNSSYNVLMTNTANQTTETTDTARFASAFKYNPSTKELVGISSMPDVSSIGSGDNLAIRGDVLTLQGDTRVNISGSQGGVTISSDSSVNISGETDISIQTANLKLGESVAGETPTINIGTSYDDAVQVYSPILYTVAHTKNEKIGQYNLTLGGGFNITTTENDGVNITGDCYATAFYETSDEHLKYFADNIPVDFDKLKEIRKSYFTWKDDKTGKTQIGTSAQDVQKVYPELVSEDNKGNLTVDYAKLSIIALSAIDKLDERLSKIEKALNISE